MKSITVPSRTVNVVKEADVIVCGGGPAGFAAAVGAARQGAKTILIENNGMLGGIWSAGLAGDISDTHLKTGYTKEFVNRILSEGYAFIRKNNPNCDNERIKVFLEQECINAGVEIRLYTKVVGVQKEDDHITYILTESKSGLEAWGAKYVVDATGDGDIGAFAECRFDMGKDGRMQPASINSVVVGIDLNEMQELNNAVFHKEGSPKERFLQELIKVGATPSYTDPGISHLTENIFHFSVNHEYGVSADDADTLTKASINGRKEYDYAISKLRQSGGRWKNLRLVATSASIGVREGRRIHGLYSIALDDLLTGKTHEDAVCKASFPIDVHSTNPNESTGYFKRPAHMKTVPYDIPLRSLIAKDVKNMFMGGRCISGDFYAHASYRVTGNAIATGYAAGFSAAYCAKNNISSHDIDFAYLAKQVR